MPKTHFSQKKTLSPIFFKASLCFVLVFSLLAPSCENKPKEKNPTTPKISIQKDSSSVQIDSSLNHWRSKTEEDWRSILTEEQFYVTREEGTERAYTGRYWDHKAKGVYNCVCCDLPLFESETKYQSGTGWPSFFQPIMNQNIMEVDDFQHGMSRVEVECARCGAHLGHVFPDGPEPTGLRYCINSASLRFEEDSI